MNEDLIQRATELGQDIEAAGVSTDDLLGVLVDALREDGWTCVPPGDLPDGVWIVVNQDGQRHEVPIELPTVGGDQVAETILSLDGKALWAEALAGASMADDPVDRMLELIASQFDPEAAASQD